MQDSHSSLHEDWQGLGIRHSRCAGLDISSSFHCCYFPPHLVKAAEANQADGGLVINFEADQLGLQALAAALSLHGVEQVVMESTGTYWYGAHRLLSQQGFKVCLVNPRHAKNIAGRKTDEQDARWLCRLHSYGLLRASFVVSEDFQDLRDLMRQRDLLLKDRSRQVLLMTKLLDQMNVKVHKVISDLSGSTGMAIVRFIAQGVPPRATNWERFHNALMKVDRATFVRTLQADYSHCTCFLLAQHLAQYDLLNEHIGAIDRYGERLLVAKIEGLAQADLAAEQEQDFIRPLMTKTGRKRKTAASKNTPLYDQHYYLQELLGVDMTTLPGMQTQSLLEILAELGTDMEQKFPTAAHFTSWLQLSPNPKISAGKVIGKKRVSSVNRVHAVFRNCAFSLANSSGYFGQFYRSIKRKSNGKTANKALARKLAVIFYKMFIHKTAYDEERLTNPQLVQQRKLARLKRQARLFGYQLVLKQTTQ